MQIDHRTKVEGQGSLAQVSLFRSLERLLELIVEENMVLSRHNVMPHGSYTDRKNQALRELVSAQKAAACSESWRDCVPLLTQLKDALCRNANLLKVHISAIGELSDIIVSCMRDSESDGTYTRHDAR